MNNLAIPSSLSTITSRSYIDDFTALQQQMNQFSVRFENTLNDKRAALITAKEQYSVQTHDLANRHQQLESQIAAMRTKIAKVTQLISTTLNDLNKQQSIVDELSAREQSLQQSKEQLVGEIDELNREITVLQNGNDKQRDQLADQVRKEYPELLKYELYLGFKIDVLGEDQLRLRFNNVDPHDIDKEVWCDVHLGGESLTVKESNPALSTEVVSMLSKRYDEDKDFVFFLKTLRTSLKDKL